MYVFLDMYLIIFLNLFQRPVYCDGWPAQSFFKLTQYSGSLRYFNCHRVNSISIEIIFLNKILSRTGPIDPTSLGLGRVT